MASPASASASKKTKLCHDHHHDEEAEDKDMEEFFALVRSIREARDRLKSNGSCEMKKQPEENSAKMKRKLEQDHKHQPVIEAWKPTFQREDFLLEDLPQLIKNVPHVTPPSSSQNKEATDQKADQEIKDQGLDLTLSL